MEIQLSSGEALSSLDVHLTLIAGATRSSDIARELSKDELGFLVHVKSKDEPPFVHGAVAWPLGPLPYHLLNPDLRTNVLLTISSLPQLLDYEEPHVWQPGRDAMLRVAAFTIGCSSGQEG